MFFQTPGFGIFVEFAAAVFRCILRCSCFIFFLGFFVMNLKFVHLKGVLGTRLCHVLSTEAVFPTRTVGALSRVAVRMSTSSSLVLRRDPRGSSAPGFSRCIASIACGGKCSLSRLSPGILSEFVRTSTTQG